MTGESPASPPDDALVARFRTGDRAAFREIVRRHAPDLLGYVGRLIGDATWAEDLVQEVFLRLFEKSATLREDERLRPWLFAVARNASLDFLRRKRLDPKLADPDPEKVSGREPTPESAFEERETRGRVEKALADLPEEFRAAFELCVIRDLSYEDAAKVLGISVKTLSSRLFRARERFRNTLKEARP